MSKISLDLRSYVRDIPDFPKKGIIFKDITPLLASPEAFRLSIDKMATETEGRCIDKIIAIESRGFIFGAALAQKLGIGFIPVRKKGKLPSKTLSISYQLEYGTDSLEIHADALRKGENVLIIDDVLATGGTAQAVADLVSQTGASVSTILFLIELTFLKGREKLTRWPVKALLSY